MMAVYAKIVAKISDLTFMCVLARACKEILDILRYAEICYFLLHISVTKIMYSVIIERVNLLSILSTVKVQVY
jgi:hypothetical protein